MCEKIDLIVPFILSSFDTVIISHHFYNCIFKLHTVKNVFFNVVNTKTLLVFFILPYMLLVLTCLLLYIFSFRKNSNFVWAITQQSPLFTQVILPNYQKKKILKICFGSYWSSARPLVSSFPILFWWSRKKEREIERMSPTSYMYKFYHMKSLKNAFSFFKSKIIKLYNHWSLPLLASYSKLFYPFIIFFNFWDKN